MASKHLRFAVLGVAIVGLGSTEALATQQVFLDFLTNPGNGGAIHTYTAGEQASILAAIQADYSSFDFSFALAAPGAGNFSTVTFNAPKDFSNNNLVGGIAQDIDFRNLITNDNARVNANGLLGGGGQPAATSANYVALTSFIGAHELGHLAGLRHADAFGPIGSGITSPTPGTNGYTPSYPGPITATESGSNLMASPASVGQTLAQAVAPAAFGERDDVKLKFAEAGTTVAEQGAAHGTFATAQNITLTTLTVPNTLLAGAQNFGKTFNVAAIDVTAGSISANGEKDYYKFTASAGLFEMEGMAKTLPGARASVLDTQISVFGADGTTLVPYFGSTATNDNEFETTDSTIIDLNLPATGTYYAEINGAGASTGGYELFAYTFAAVPEPGSVMLILAGAPLLMMRRRRGAAV